jgi:acyl-lipid omega-6 desaturase (Delta-12 desaturase)
MSAEIVEDDSASFDQAVLAPFMRRRIFLPAGIFALSFLIYGSCVVSAVIFTSLTAKILLGVVAGVFIANLAIIGHDAVHRSFTSSRRLNRVIGTIAFLPALHPYGRWEHHHNRVHHRYTAQIGVDNAFSPMTVEQYRTASLPRRLYYRFMRSLGGQPFFYMIDIWLPKIFLPLPSETRSFRPSDWIDLVIVYAWLASFIVGLTYVSQIDSGQSFGALSNAALFGFLIPFLVWNVFIAFVTIVQHTGPNARWMLPTGRPSTHEQKLRGTVHIRFPDALDWFFHRVMQHIAHHVNPMVPLYSLRAAENIVTAQEADRAIVELWTPAYHWRLARDCKLYDPVCDGWCNFDLVPTGQGTSTHALTKIAPSAR